MQSANVNPMKKAVKNQQQNNNLACIPCNLIKLKSEQKTLPIKSLTPPKIPNNTKQIKEPEAHL